MEQWNKISKTFDPDVLKHLNEKLGAIAATTTRIEATTGRIETAVNSTSTTVNEIATSQRDAKAMASGTVPLIPGVPEHEELNKLMRNMKLQQLRVNVLRKNAQDARDARQDALEQRRDDRLNRKVELATAKMCGNDASSSNVADPELTKALEEQTAFKAKQTAAAKKRAASAAKRQAAVDKVAEPVAKDAAERPKALKRRARRNPADGMAEPSAAASAAVESKDDAEVEQPPVDAPIDANANSANSVPLAALAVHNEAVQAAQPKPKRAHRATASAADVKDVLEKRKAKKTKAFMAAVASMTQATGMQLVIDDGSSERVVQLPANPAVAASSTEATVPDPALLPPCEECGSNDCVMTIVVGDVTKQLCQVCQKKRDEAMAAEAAPPKVTSNKSGFKGKTLGVDFDIADFAFQDER